MSSLLPNPYHLQETHRSQKLTPQVGPFTMSLIPEGCCGLSEQYLSKPTTSSLMSMLTACRGLPISLRCIFLQLSSKKI